MTKMMTIKTTPARRTHGFTLIEMLVVAALIAIFAGLAVFNIVEQMQREKEKAALAEARSIATAMSFAYDDLGFFPKLCFLRFGLDELKKVIIDEGLSDDAIEYHSFPNPAMATMINKNWGEKYMSGTMPEKSVEMTIPTTNGDEVFDWPADPFRQPYVGYFVKVETPPTGGAPVISWLSSSGDKPNYFAGIVSYGRNKVPGLKWDAIPADITARQTGRMYSPLAGGNDRQFQYFAPTVGNYSPARLKLLTEQSTDPGHTPGQYHIRENGSDDKFYEF